MVPIVAADIEGNGLSIYDAGTDQQHALNAVRVKNITGMHLAGGPVTVFQEGIYAGDTQFRDMQPDDSRLWSYAVDLELVPDFKQQNPPQVLLTVSAKKGVLLITRKQQIQSLYSFCNKSAADKPVVVQYADPGTEFKIVEPEKWTEKTATEYRFLITVPAGKTSELKVVAERPVTQTVALVDANLDFLLVYARNQQAPEKLRQALAQLVTMRRHIADLQAQRNDLQAELGTIDQEQNRIRQNMAQLDRNSALYQEYVSKFTRQENRVEAVRAEIKRVHDAEIAARKDLDSFVDGLTIA